MTILETIELCEMDSGSLKMFGGVSLWCIVKVMDCGILVSEFVLQLRYYVHFWANTLGKGMNLPYSPCYGSNSTTTVLGEMALALNNIGWYAIKQRTKSKNVTYQLFAYKSYD